MLYPTGFLGAVGEVLMQIDFIGPRRFGDCTQPLHFLSIKYVRPCRAHIFLRITAQSTNEVLRCFSEIFFEQEYPLPDVVQMDNDAAFRGYTKQKGVIGRIIKWLCHNGSVPVFNAPNSPWNNGSVEGGNSVFDKKFWHRFRFDSLEDVDRKLKLFNAAYDKYLKTGQKLPSRPKPRLHPKKFRMKDLNFFPQPFLFLLRVVRKHGQYCRIDVVNRYVRLPEEYRGQYVIVQIHITDHWMKVWQETGSATHLLLQRSFKV